MFDGAVSAIYTGTVTDAPPERKKTKFKGVVQFTLNLQTKLSDIYTSFRVQNIHLKVNNDIIEISSTVKPVFRGPPSEIYSG